MSFDHGVLNVPLHKRGNIDREIDAYKAEQTKQAKAASKARSAEMKVRRAELAALRVKAKAAVASVDHGFLARIAERNGTTPARVKAILKEEANLRPALALRMLEVDA